ncbi:hypothetical protein GOODEAATRI_016832 [Goodea atripinnis]|uniref:Thymidylate kinase-like domain-containing protein n=1 Tax=Goodea atripinnis TaxID=208336 RepID=A0ABV0NV62_9TELE
MARHLKPLVQRWSSRVFSVELDGAPLYFGIREKLRGATVLPAVFSRLQKEDRCYSLLVCSRDRIRGDRFHWELRDKLLKDLPPGSDVATMSSFLPDEKGSLVKGYFFKSRAENSPLIEGILSDLEHTDPVLVCSYSQSEDGQQWTQNLWSHAEKKQMKFYVVPSEAPKHHPSALNMINSDVFYSLDEASWLSHGTGSCHSPSVSHLLSVPRFWHSTAAYAIATAVTGPVSNLPHDGSEVYCWPSDLLQPSLVVLLTLDPEERTRRLRNRGLMKTDEEQELDHNKRFRDRVEEAYQRIIGPLCITVDASPSADLVPLDSSGCQVSMFP